MNHNQVSNFYYHIASKNQELQDLLKTFFNAKNNELKIPQTTNLIVIFFPVVI